MDRNNFDNDYDDNIDQYKKIKMFFLHTGNSIPHVKSTHYMNNNTTG